LEKYRDSFHSSRTAKSLEAHYYRMKRTGAFEKPSNNGALQDESNMEDKFAKNGNSY
jgi:hypothetical protein